MKKLIIIATLLLFISCGGGGSTVILPPSVPPPEPEPTPIIRTIFIYDSAAQTIGTSDGEFYYDLDAGKSANARDGLISVGDILHGIDDTGKSIISQRLPVTPDKIAIAGADIWIFQNIYDAQTGRDYTKIWLDNSEYGTWRDNQYTVSEAIVTDSRDIVILDTGGRYRNILDPTMVVNYAGHDNLLIYGVDVASRRANIRDASGDYRVAFSTNYFFGAKKWVRAADAFYSWNGYIWDGTTLSELATPLTDFVTLWHSERPVLSVIGSRTEHGESVAYWLECNSGILYRYTPSINTLEEVILLYQGDGTRNSGQIAATEIKPVLTAENLFFTWSGTVWKYEFASGLGSSFAAGVEIWKM